MDGALRKVNSAGTSPIKALQDFRMFQDVRELFLYILKNHVHPVVITSFQPQLRLGVALTPMVPVPASELVAKLPASILRLQHISNTYRLRRPQHGLRW